MPRTVRVHLPQLCRPIPSPPERRDLTGSPNRISTSARSLPPHQPESWYHRSSNRNDRAHQRTSIRRTAIATYTVEPDRRTLHGHFSRDLPPILTIDSGDTVSFRTLEAGWGLEPRHADNRPRATFTPRDAEFDAGHALCGPIAVRGAAPGMTLAVEIGDLRPGTWGWTVAGGWDSPVNTRLGFGAGVPGTALHWRLDPDRLLGWDQHQHQVSLRPFLGVIGMPPDVPGRHPTSPPRPTGGNIDCKELVPGSTLFLPIAVPGGLVSVGDGHALQADGEASSTAIECPMDRAELTFRLLTDLHLTTPRAETPVGWLTFGFDESLDEAMLIALDAMLDLMTGQHSLPRAEALALASLLVDLRITQVVNGVRGVHAVLPHGVLLETSRAVEPSRP
jgi:acetamidase/formamidase